VKGFVCADTADHDRHTAILQSGVVRIGQRNGRRFWVT
jgi:hypothetical protein